MACIKRFVTERRDICVISDRHPGIMKAMSEDNGGWKEPEAHHRLCLRHLASNLNTQFKNADVKKAFGQTAEQHQERKFTVGLNKLGDINARARQYLEKIGFHRWSLCHDEGRRYGLKTTNMTEVFNNVMKGARYLPVTALVQLSFYRVNAYFVERRGMANRRLTEEHRYTHKVTNLLQKNIVKAAHHEVVAFEHKEGVYEVTTGRGDRSYGKGGHIQVVNLREKTCSCKKLQIYKLPCSHVLAVCSKFSLSPAQFVDTFYYSKEYLATYKPSFQPIPDKGYWRPYTGPKLVVNSSSKRGQGRPVSKRLRNEMDDTVRASYMCSVCHQTGHNKKTCPLLRAKETSDGSTLRVQETGSTI